MAKVEPIAQAPQTIDELLTWLGKRIDESLKKRKKHSSLIVRGLLPHFLSKEDAADFLGVPSKSISNELSAGRFPIKPVYRNSKPLFPYVALLEYARSLETQSSEPARKRGRKRNGGTMVKGQSRDADFQERKNQAGGPGGQKGGDAASNKYWSQTDRNQ
jgi:hypothetical protein